MLDFLRTLAIPVMVMWAAVGAAREAAAEQTLKEAFTGRFKMGAALGTEHVLGRETKARELVARQFNSITPENLLKWAEVHPEPAQYNFEPADRYVEFGEKHDMFIVGHTLVWHNQTPEWAFTGIDDQPLDRETALARIKEHIATVVGRYKGRINGWDVVNEAIDDQGKFRSGPVGPPGQRGEPWHAAIGDDYVQKAFEFAHAADPDAELYYNDYNEWHPEKIVGISRLVGSLKAAGVRIDGIGLQGHWGMDYPRPAEIDHMLTEYGKLGVKLMITELDINLLPDANRRRGADITRREELRKELDPYRAGLPDEMQQKLAQRYAEIFSVFDKHRDTIDRVTFWGIHDGHSWLNNWPIRGRTSYPLLFDRELAPKPAFQAVIEQAATR